MSVEQNSLRRARAVMVVAIFAGVASCHHTLEPVKPSRLELRGQPFPAGVALRIENGYAAPETRRLRSDFVHKLDADLRDWSARLVSELQLELERVGATCIVPDEALAGTSVAPLAFTPRPARMKEGSYPVLRVRITEILAPDPDAGRGPYLSASLESASGDFTAIYATGPGLKGFSDAQYELKSRILQDPRFHEWLRSEADFRPLWNGRDLSGWVKVLDSDWTVENGILLSRQNPAGRREGESWLITERDYEDFILRAEFRLTAGGNSGVFLRDPVPRAERLAAADGATPPWDAGFEANINAEEPNYPTGSLWALAKGPRGLDKPGEWNELLIRVEGDRVRTWVNGKLAVDARQSRSKRGAIGLQRHGTAQYRDKVIEFRKIEIAELK